MLHEAAVSIWSVIGRKCEPVADKGNFAKYLLFFCGVSRE